MVKAAVDLGMRQSDLIRRYPQDYKRAPAPVGMPSQSSKTTHYLDDTR